MLTEAERLKYEPYLKIIHSHVKKIQIAYSSKFVKDQAYQILIKFLITYKKDPKLLVSNITCQD